MPAYTPSSGWGAAPGIFDVVGADCTASCVFGGVGAGRILVGVVGVRSDRGAKSVWIVGAAGAWSACEDVCVRSMLRGGIAEAAW
jgi:hypothetical protein